MRIIWFTPGFASTEDDTESLPYLQQLALELRQSADLQIVALEYPFTNEPYLWHDIPVYPCNGQNRRWLKWRTALYAWKYGIFLCKNQPVVVFQSFWLGWAAILAERLLTFVKYFLPGCSATHFCTLMGQDALSSNERYLRRLGGKMQERLICLSDFHKEKLQMFLLFKPSKLEKLGRLEKLERLRELKVIPFGIRATEVRQNFTGSRTIDILGVGSLVAIKNWDRWLQIVATIVAENPDTTAVLIGKGVLEQHLRHQIQVLGIGRQVSIRSDMNRPAILECMGNTKVLLHTADFESQGYIFAEAAAQGCRMVSTPVGIALQMADCGNSVEDLTQKVRTALRFPASDQPAVPFKMEDTVKAYLDLYQSNSPLGVKT